jgi:hypothetical protein
MVYYASKVRVGLSRVSSLGDGYTINLQWFQAYPSVYTNDIAYHIYYATTRDRVFSEGVKFVVVDGSTEVNIISLTPGQDYFFSVRPVEYDPTVFNLNNLPVAYDNVRFYPSSILRQNMSATDLIVPLMDVTGFTSAGIVKIGVELIQYLSVDTINDNLIVPSNIAPVPGQLVLQPNNQYYSPNSNNVGSGTINNLTLVSGDQTESWSIVCIFSQPDDAGNQITKFTAIGSKSGSPVDGYGNFLTWLANGPVVSNGILSFSITETTTFQVDDSFLVQTVGPIPGSQIGRGFDNTPITPHFISGHDGYHFHDPMVSEFTPGESFIYDQIYVCLSRFEYPHFPFTVVDGYRQVLVDYLSNDLEESADPTNVTFPMYDYSGYHRTDPTLLLNGTCVGSYIGGQMGCIDAYGNYNIVRGLSIQDQSTQRLDVLLSLTGRPAVLIRRVQTGVTCSCYISTSEYPDDRCPFCYGTKFVFGYEQYFNPRESDGRILVRAGPTAENLKMHEGGLESEFPVDLWTLTVPTIKTRDVIILFDQNDNETFRYEVGDVVRNDLFMGLDGGQHLKTFRIRKTDPAYQIRVFRNTADFPSTLNTTLGFTPGIPPHTHTIVVSEKVLSVSQINQTTGVTQGHNHPIVNGTVMTVLGHTHQIVLP